METYLTGIDIGISGAKGMVFDLAGTALGAGYREYPCTYPRPGWVEQDADLLVESTMQAMAEAVRASNVPPKAIVSLSLSARRQRFRAHVIVAILLGGTSLNGGKGSVIGMLLGAMVVAVLGNGLDMLNVLTFWQSVLKGAILVAAVILNEKVLASARRRSMKAHAA